MLRDVRVAPDGKLVVYSALGHLYTRPLPAGEPKRLTSAGADTYEFFPSFSRDGQWIVYTTWSDANQGRVRVIKLDGSAGRDVVTRPGHYVEPSFSPDGRFIVYRHAGGDSTRGPFYADDAGIRGARPAARLFSRVRAVRIRSSITPARIYIREVPAKSTLLSVGAPTSPRLCPGVTRSSTCAATTPQIVPRPTASGSRSKSDIAPTSPPSRAPAGPSMSAATDLSVQRVSRDAGFLHWSGDSRRLFCWALGPELFSRDLAHSFAFVEGGQAKAAEPEAKGIPIGFTARPICRRARSRLSARA